MQINGKNIPWKTLGELLEDKAARHGGKMFAEIDGVRVSYVELERRSRHVAGGLLALGLAPGDRVATFMLNALEQLLVWFGTVRAGLVWVPLNAGLVGQDLRYTLTNSGARVLVADTESLPHFLEVAAQTQMLSLYVVADAKTAAASGAQPYAALEAGPLPTTLPATRAEDPGAILYTGGTTGLPKGVVLPQFSFILSGVRYGESFSVRAGERHYSTMPLFHAGALQWGLMGPLVCDMSTVIDRRFSASRYFERVREVEANVIDPLGVVLTMLCRRPPSPQDREHKVRISLGATQGLPSHIPDEFTRRFGIPLVMVYGLTEGGGAMLTTNRDRKDDSNGSPHGWVELRILDEDGFPLPDGETGKLVLRSNFPFMFMTGYWNDPARTAQVLKDGWLHSGDLGWLQADGRLRFIGREAHWLRRRGENISAVEVETVLAKCPGVKEVAVVAGPSEIGEDEVKAFVVAEEGAQLAPAELVAWCEDKLAPFKVPRFVEFIALLPRSVAKMEIDRAALRKRPNDAAWDREREQPRAARGKSSPPAQQ
ncbi:Long-chain-fatty-acid--CoA ligase [Variovorax sp. PBL-E5]|nr:Long-chain-fatty-acid--CoA ligase [Variovorax sp. PBL-E5]